MNSSTSRKDSSDVRWFRQSIPTSHSRCDLSYYTDYSRDPNGLIPPPVDLYRVNRNINSSVQQSKHTETHTIPHSTTFHHDGTSSTGPTHTSQRSSTLFRIDQTVWHRPRRRWDLHNHSRWRMQEHHIISMEFHQTVHTTSHICTGIGPSSRDVLELPTPPCMSHSTSYIIRRLRLKCYTRSVVRNHPDTRIQHQFSDGCAGTNAPR